MDVRRSGSHFIDGPGEAFGSMRVIGVIDLRGGRAVHARGGRRAAYAPVRTIAGTAVNGDAILLARGYVNALGVRELYVADLDAIECGGDDMQHGVIAGLATLDVPLWVDAGTSTATAATKAREVGATTVVVGLETLTTFDALGSVCEAVGGPRVAFSLDLRHGVPVVAPNGPAGLSSATDVAIRAAAAGARTVIVLDLARVGTGDGIDLRLMEAVRRAVPDVALIAGGGVRDAADLQALATVGCDGALVATALLNGAIGATAGALYQDRAVDREGSSLRSESHTPLSG